MHGGRAAIVVAAIAHVHMRFTDLVTDQVINLLHPLGQPRLRHPVAIIAPGHGIGGESAAGRVHQPRVSPYAGVTQGP
jgi:hypothetical protein